jgi:hypothetical protein
MIVFFRTVLEIGDEKETKYYIPSTAGMVNLKVALPQGVTCSQCILQVNGSSINDVIHIRKRKRMLNWWFSVVYPEWH